MVGQVIQSVSPLRSLQVTMALVPVQMAMANGVVLERTVHKRPNDSETLLCCLHCLQLELLDLLLGEALSSDLSHFEGEVEGRYLCQARRLGHYGHH